MELFTVVEVGFDFQVSDDLIVLEGIDSRVEKSCRSVVDLPPDDALAVRPILNSLLDDLKDFSEELQTKVRTLSA